MSHQPLTNVTIREAVNLWFDNQEQCIQTFGHISTWNTEQVTDMSKLFENRTTFNEVINFDTQNVTDMSHMFYCAYKFNQPLYHLIQPSNTEPYTINEFYTKLLSEYKTDDPFDPILHNHFGSENGPVFDCDIIII